MNPMSAARREIHRTGSRDDGTTFSKRFSMSGKTCTEVSHHPTTSIPTHAHGFALSRLAVL